MQKHDTTAEYNTESSGEAVVYGKYAFGNMLIT